MIKGWSPTILDFDPNLIQSISNQYYPTLDSGIDVGQGINVGPGKVVKKNKRRALNKRRA